MREPRNRVLPGAVGVAILGAGLLPACGGPTELTWHEGQGYRWADVGTGFRDRTGFAQLNASRTNIRAINSVTPEEVTRNRHYLNGSGVAAGDVDGDGLVDLYFASLMGPNTLYRNRGGLEFEDITAEAGVAHEDHLSTGVVFADVDHDGDLDLLVASLHHGVALYLNDGAGAFREVPDAGLDAAAGKGSHTLALADVDGDGHLDLYVANYRERSINDLVDVRELTWENTVEETRAGDSVEYRLRAPFGDYFTILFREEGLPPERREVGERDLLFLGDGQGRFEEVADPATRFLDPDGEPRGLDRDWGLAAKFHDLNGDHRPDLYVANDFWTPDRVWINQGAGVFRAIDPLAIRNLSFSSMTVDFADVDRDGAEDIFVTEMLSPLHERRARHYRPKGPYPTLRFQIDGQPQHNRNSLYLGRGDGTFAQTAYYSGVEASGWSWGTHFLDVDLDGYEDLLVATGFAYDLQDMDTQLRMYQELAQGARASQGHLTDYPPLHLANRAYRNNRDRTFSDASGDWGFEEADISQAIAVADLDNDGDLDLTINRLNAPAALYENRASASRIAVRLRGEAPNTQAIGATVGLEGGPVAQQKEVVAGGTYLSGSDPMVVFAADEEGDHVLTVTWPDGRRTVIDGLAANRIYEVRQSGAGEATAGEGRPRSAPIFADISDRIDHTHHESRFDDWWLQPFLPVGLSRQGPGVSWLDIDADGDDDLVIAAGRGGRLAVFENRGDGRLTRRAVPGLTGSTGGDQTTILGWPGAAAVTVVVGNANLEQGNVGAPAALTYTVTPDGATPLDSVPDNLSTTGPLAAADYDADGDLDLFVGGRFIPAQYPLDATSRLFRNDGGRFGADRSNAGALRDVGLVTGAVFTDFDQDGDPDLVVSREWGSMALFENRDGTFHDITEAVGLDRHRGWWNGVATGDFNNDGRPDIVATNWGLNSPYRVDPQHPLRMYYGDFDLDHRVDIIEAYYDTVAGDYVPRRQLFDYQSVASALLRGIQSHRDFASATIDEILGPRAGSTPFLEVNELRHTLFINEGDHFSAQPLPAETQLSAAFAATVADYDNDGHEDVFLGQNLFYVRHDLPRLDAGRGVWLKGDGEGGFQVVPGHVTGITVYGEQKGAALSDFDADGRVDLAVTQNGAETRLYHNRSDRRGMRIRLVGPEANRNAIGSSVRIAYRDGSTGPRREIQAGSGYWSQGGAVPVLGVAPGRTVDRVEVSWFDGSTGTIPYTEGRLDYVIRHPSAPAGSR